MKKETLCSSQQLKIEKENIYFNQQLNLLCKDGILEDNPYRQAIQHPFHIKTETNNCVVFQNKMFDLLHSGSIFKKCV